MRVTILDYGVGNLHSLAKAIVAAGGAPQIVDDAARALDGDVLVLPGVGAFEPAAARLAAARDAVRAAILGGLPTLGICLGMQLLFDSSDEGAGLGLSCFSGRVERLNTARVPQIGWNGIDDVADPVLRQAAIVDGYYANSFVCRPHDPSIVTAWSTYDGDRFPAAVRRGRTVGLQFHPEKSSTPGVACLKAFLEEAA